MSINDREDALARALDLLSEGDPARSDPRLLRDPELAAEARATRETAADVWLAVSPLRAAPPESLPGILEKIPPPTRTTVVRRRPAFAAIGGWAAAAVVALAWLLWPDPELSPAAIGAASPPDAPAVISQSPVPAPGHPAAQARTTTDRDRLREELARLRRSLTAERAPDGATIRPRVVELRPPGSPRLHPDEARERLLAALANALRGVLEEEANDPASLVIERGWFPQGAIRLGDDELVRHRSFPSEFWNDHGLLRSEDGRFYDPATMMIWERDPGSPDYLGRRAAAGDDLAAFELEEAPKKVEEAEVYVQSAPAGYLIEDPASGDAQLVLEGLQPLPPGGSYLLVGNASHGETTFHVPITNGATSVSIPRGMSEFSLVQSLSDGSTAIILTGGN